MKHQSVVKWFDAKKGYGFLVDPEGGADIFVHYTSIHSEARFRTLRTGEEVTFDLTEGPKGSHARDVLSLDPLPIEEEEGPQARFQPPSPQDALAVRQTPVAPAASTPADARLAAQEPAMPATQTDAHQAA